MSRDVIGGAVLTVEADAPDFAGQVESKSRGPLAKVGSTLANALGTTFKAGLATAGAAAAGVIGLSLTKGLSRLTAIDSATARLKGMGIEGKALKGVMDSVNDSVTGTAFGLDEAASAAALMMTSGVKGGKELDNTLGGIVATAAASGSTLSEITGIWQQMATTGKASSDQIYMLGNRGVNALDALAKHFGVTQQEAQKMVSDGKVSFEDFNAAMQGELGEMAAAMGSSFEGMRSNVIAGFGRLGAAVLGPVFEGMKPVMGAIIDQLRVLTPMVTEAIAPVADRITGMFERIASVIGGFDLSNLFSGLGSSIGELNGLLAPLAGLVLGALGPLLSQVPLIGRVFSGLTGPVGLVIGLFVEMFRQSKTLRDAIGQIFPALGSIVSALFPVFEALGNVIGAVARAFGDVLGNVIRRILPIIVELVQMLGPVLGKVINALIPVIIQIGNAFSSVLMSAISALLPVIGTLVRNVLPVLVKVFMSLIPVIQKVISTVLPPLLTLFESLVPVVMQLVSAVLPVLLNLFQQLVPVILSVVTAVAPLVAQLIEALVPVITTLITSVLPILVSLFETLAPIILQIATAVIPPLIEILTGVVDIIVELLPYIAQFIEFLASFLQPAIENLMPVVETVFGVILDVITTVMEQVQNIIDLVMAVIKGDWEGAWDAIKSFLSTAWDLIKSIVSGAIEIVKSVISAAWQNVLGTTTRLWDSIRSMVGEKIEAARKKVSEIIEKIKTIMSDAWENVKQTAQNAWNRIKDAVTNTIDVLRIEISALPGKIVSWIGNLGNLLWQKGKDIIQGLINGIRNMGSTLWNAVVDLVKSNIPGPIASILGISSPSKVTMRLGEQIAEGLAVGMQHGRREILAAAKGLTEAASVKAVGTFDLTSATHGVPRRPVATAPGVPQAPLPPVEQEPRIVQITVQVSPEDLAGLRAVEDFVRMVDVRSRMVKGVGGGNPLG